MEFIEEAIKGDWLLQHPEMQHRSDERVSNQWCMLDPDRLQSKVYSPKVGETELILSYTEKTRNDTVSTVRCPVKKDSQKLHSHWVEDGRRGASGGQISFSILLGKLYIRDM